MTAQKFITLAPLTGLLFFGCATEPPSSRVERLIAPVARDWTAKAEESAPAASWLDDFPNPGLTAMVIEALGNNIELEAAAARLEALAAVASGEGGSAYPALSYGIGASRSRGASRTGGSVRSQTGNQFGATLDLSWEIDVWGRLADLESASIADAQAAAATFHGARLSLAATATRLWLELAANTQTAELARKTLEAYDAATRTIDARFQQGLSAAVDLRLARSQTALARASLAQTQQRVDATARRLEILLGRYPGAEIVIPASLPELKGRIPSGIPSELITRRPDLIAAERAVAAAEVRIDVARKAFLPRFSLTASGGTRSDRLEEVLDSNWSIWTLAGNVVGPLFQGRQLTSNLERAEARALEAVANFGQRVLVAFREVETALASEAFLATQLAAQREAASESIEAEALAWERYQSGLEDIIVVLETQRRAFEFQSTAIQVHLAQLTNRVNLHLALGGGFVDFAPETVRISSPFSERQVPLQPKHDTVNP